MAHHSEPALTNGRRSGGKSILEKRKSGRKRLALTVRPAAGEPEDDFQDAEDGRVILVGPLGEASIEQDPANDDEAGMQEHDNLAAGIDSIESAQDDVDGNGGEASPDQVQMAAAAPALSDPELIAILQQLSTTIDTAHQVLDEANALETTRTTAAAVPEARSESLSPAVSSKPEEPLDPEDSYEGIRQERPVFPRPYMKPPVSSGKGIGFAALGACIVTVGAIAWIFHANPWLTETAIDSATQTAPLAVATGKPAAPRIVESSLTAKGPAQTRSAEAAADTPRGSAGAPIPLQIELPQAVEGTEISLMVQGIPDKASLSAGRNIGGGVWIVDFADADNLMLTVPPGFNGKQVDIEVTFVKSDGKVPEARLIDVVIDPARAPRSPDGLTDAAGSAGAAPLAAASPLRTPREPAPGGAAPAPAALAVAAPTATPQAAPSEPSVSAPQPAVVPAPRPAAATRPAAAPKPAILQKDLEVRLLARGEEMMKAGDIAGARLIYEHAARRGSRTAMTELGKSFDPEHLAKLGVLGVKPDKEQAKAWYERASRTADR